MAGTKEGGKLAAKRNIEKYGENFYSKIGKIGGENGRTGGFAATKYYPLDHPAHPINAGRKGGVISKRPSKKEF